MSERVKPRRSALPPWNTAIAVLAIVLPSIGCGPHDSTRPRSPVDSTPYRHDQLTTEVLFCVDSHGETRKIEVVRTSGDPALDRAIVQEVETWRFKPSPTGKLMCTVVRFDKRADGSASEGPQGQRADGR